MNTESDQGADRQRPNRIWAWLKKYKHRIELLVPAATIIALIALVYQVDSSNKALNVQSESVQLQARAIDQQTLAIERQTKSIEQQEYGNLKTQQQELFILSFNNSELYVKTLLHPGDLTDEELWQYTELIYLRLELLLRFQRANDNQILPPKDLDDEYSLVPIFLGSRVGRIVWEGVKEDYRASNPDFVERIDQSLADNAYLDDEIFFEELLMNVRGKLSNSDDALQK